MSINSALIFKKMSEVMKDVGSVGKDQRNQAQGFAFRGIDQFVNALYPALVANGVFMVPRCVSQSSEVREVERGSGKKGFDKIVTLMMEYDFFAEDGSKVTIGPIPAEGLDSGDKATNKALSAALKYALIQTFTVPTKDMEEADRESPQLAPPPKRDIVREVQAKTTAPAPAKAAPVAAATASVPNDTKAVAAPAARTASFRRSPAAAPAKEAAKPAPAPAQSQDAEPEIEM
jgi:hypothetical protein